MAEGEAVNEMDASGLFVKIIDSLLDSLTFTIIKRQMKAGQDNIGKNEVTKGKTSYIIDCLHLYNSERLDSIIKSVPRFSYVLKLTSGDNK
jgi:hypothetical protein